MHVPRLDPTHIVTVDESHTDFVFIGRCDRTGQPLSRRAVVVHQGDEVRVVGTDE